MLLLWIFLPVGGKSSYISRGNQRQACGELMQRTLVLIQNIELTHTPTLFRVCESRAFFLVNPHCYGILI